MNILMFTNVIVRLIKICLDLIAGPKEARNPNLDSDQRISYYACVPCL